MDSRAVTAYPKFRTNFRLTTTDVTSPFRRIFGSDVVKSHQRFSSQSSVPRPFTTVQKRRSSSETPPNFSWIDLGWLAACALPTNPGQYRFLFENGVRHVVSLMKNRPTGAMESVQLPKLNRLKIRIDDNCAPTLNQIRQFLKIVEDANDRMEAVVVHCANGNGGTGTMLACYLVKMRQIDGAEALRQIRKMRPGSVESIEQEKVVEQFYHHFKQV